jgi:hypothetical protein
VKQKLTTMAARIARLMARRRLRIFGICVNRFFRRLACAVRA